MGIASSIAAVLAAYILGQISYGATYLLRPFLPVPSAKVKEDPEYNNKYMWIVERHTTYYTAEVFRYRNFARFSMAMVLPSSILGIVLSIQPWYTNKAWPFAIALITVIAVVSFIWRYYRYGKECNKMVDCCWEFDWERHQINGAPAKTLSDKDA